MFGCNPVQAVQALDEALGITPRDFLNVSHLWTHRARACLQQELWALGMRYFSISASFAAVLGSPLHYRHRAILYNLGDFHPAALCSFLSLNPEEQHRALENPESFWGALTNIATYPDQYEQLGISNTLWTAPMGAQYRFMPLSPLPSTPLGFGPADAAMTTRGQKRPLTAPTPETSSPDHQLSGVPSPPLTDSPEDHFWISPKNSPQQSSM